MRPRSRDRGLRFTVAVVGTADYWLLGLFGPLTLAETDAWAATVLVDDVDAGRFASAPNQSHLASRGAGWNFRNGQAQESK
jgi:hypothetical protein